LCFLEGKRTSIMGQVIYFLSLNLTRIAELRKEDLVKHIRKKTIQTGRLFFPSSLTNILTTDWSKSQ